MRAEQDFLADLLPRLGGADESIVLPPGDDCAALRWAPGELLLLAVDQLVEGVHYYPDTDPALAGRKLLARNLSDIAAMGGRPLWALAALAFPADRPDAWVEAFVDGMLALAEARGVRIIGGDVAAAPLATGSLTIVGRVRDEHLCRRDAAAAGDLLLATGSFGDSLASNRHLTFEPRLAEGAWLAEGGWTHCMIDISDGLLTDLRRLCKASALGAVLDPLAIPANGSLAGALSDGEDYELLFAISADRLGALQASWPFATPLTPLGTFVADSACKVRKPDGEAYGHTGFEHFGVTSPPSPST
jgi:thiamine-monophosphate kinase